MVIFKNTDKLKVLIYFIQKPFKDSIIKLQACAFELSKKVLKPNGYFLCKLWFGDGISEFQKSLQKHFEKVRIIKPPASRLDSAEIFLFCYNFKNEIKS